MSGRPLLDVADLSVDYASGLRTTRAVDGVSFEVQPGQTLGLVGESGCGKSTVIRALLRLLPPAGQVVGGSATYKGTDLVTCNTKELRRLRWREIAVVPQTSMNSLDPVHKVGDQVAEPLREHLRLARWAARERVEEVARLVGLDPARLNDYPHQFSGGMRQRIVLAMALVLKPELLIADEPTTALDVITQHRILEQVVEIQRELGLSIVFITHDIGVVWRTCESVAVMYAGRIMEMGAVADVLTDPVHPYTMGLLNASPSIRSTERLTSIPGHPPRLTGSHVGCPFTARCPFAVPECSTQTPPLRAIQGRVVACHRAEEAAELRAAATDSETWSTRTTEVA